LVLGATEDACKALDLKKYTKQDIRAHAARCIDKSGISIPAAKFFEFFEYNYAQTRRLN